MRTLKLTFTLLFALFIAGFTFAQDWANTSRFKDENAKLAPASFRRKSHCIYGELHY